MGEILFSVGLLALTISNTGILGVLMLPVGIVTVATLLWEVTALLDGVVGEVLSIDASVYTELRMSSGESLTRNKKLASPLLFVISPRMSCGAVPDRGVSSKKI